MVYFKIKYLKFLKNEIKTFLLQQMIAEGNEPTGAAERQEKFQSHHPHCLTRPGDLASTRFDLAANVDTLGTCPPEDILFYWPDLRQ